MQERHKEAGKLLWMAVSADPLELPIAVAESGAELARMLGTSAENIYKKKALGTNGKSCGYLVVTTQVLKEERMKYSILEAFRDYLKSTMNPNTAKKYYQAVKEIFEEAVFESLEEVDTAYIEEQMKMLPSKNEFSAAKCGLLKLQEFDPSLELPENEFFKTQAKKKRNHVKSRGQKIYRDTVMRKVNKAKDARLRLAYRLAMCSGLRISEVAALLPEDIDLSEERIKVFVRNGKGGKSGTVTCLDAPYVRARLTQELKTAESGKQLFYGAGHMMNQASALGFECHDLRRIFAQDMELEQLSLRKNKKEAGDAVRMELRHSKMCTTDLYLKGRKVIRKTGKGGKKS